eukprot:272512_1
MAAHVHLVPEVHHSGKHPPVIFFFLSLLAGIALKFISKRLISPVPYTTYLLLVGIVSRYDTMIDNGAISSEGKKNDGAVLKAKNVRNLVERDDRDAARARRARINEMALACRGGPVGVPHGEVEARPPVGRRFKLFGREIPTWTGWVLIAVVVACSVVLYLEFNGPTEPTCNAPLVPFDNVLTELNLIYTPETCDFVCNKKYFYFKNDKFTVGDLASDDFELEVATRQTRTRLANSWTPLKNCDVTKSPLTFELFGGSKAATYVGQLNSGIPDGNGTATFTDGSIYVGQWTNDGLNGIAKINFKHTHGPAYIYVGEVANGVPRGKGLMTKYDQTWNVTCEDMPGGHHFCDPPSPG